MRSKRFSSHLLEPVTDHRQRLSAGSGLCRVGIARGEDAKLSAQYRDWEASRMSCMTMTPCA